jgi:threonylcarbamoyladenosine tRNA methylthiotransferase MtaB
MDKIPSAKNVKTSSRSADQPAPPEVVTFGCRLNSYESEVMKLHAVEAGLENVMIFNTCAVTAEATRQARQSIRRAKRENPDLDIIVTGCAAQVDPEEFAKMNEVSRVMGNGDKLESSAYKNFAQWTKSNVDKGADFGVDIAEKIVVNDIMAVTETAPQFIDGYEERSRAFVQVQNGCDHRCTFCIIPYGRGNSRSVPQGEVVQQIKRLVDNGYNEVIITGVDITSYGPDLPGKPTLGTLCQKILKLVPDLKRLRLSSIDSIEADEALFQVITKEERMMPHLHISLQAGDNMILKRMKRRHSREDTIEFCRRVREARPDVVFGADIIAGFPTETEEMFLNSMKIIKDCDLTYLHVFPYSEREGTPAARMPGMPKKIRKERAARLRASGDLQVEKFNKSQLDKEVQILIEKKMSPPEEGDSFIGHTQHFAPAKIRVGSKIESLELGMVVTARVTAYKENILICDLI